MPDPLPTPNARQSRPVLLTDEAVRAAYHADPFKREDTLAAVLRYHATEGREALVEKVALAIGGSDPDGVHAYRAAAERVVAALVGEDRRMNPTHRSTCCCHARVRESGYAATLARRWPTISAWTAGRVVEAPRLVRELRDALDYWGGDPS